MNIVRDLLKPGSFTKGMVVALGNFDGVHLGHQSILRECAALASAHNVPAAVMTFEPHPREFFAPNQPPLRIHSLHQKIECLRDAGIRQMFMLRFNKTLATTSANDFVENILHKTLGVKHVVTGYNFAFGKGRAGDSAFLTEKARELNFGFTAHEQVLDKTGAVISSSAIRHLLQQGEIARASAMLGRPYQITGHVVHGEKRGRALGFPTANFSLKKRFRPRFGVYAAWVNFEGERVWHPAAASIGINPTFSLSSPLLEAHCLNMSCDVYGKRARVELVRFMRDEMKFDDVELLKKQMAQDCIAAKTILHG